MLLQMAVDMSAHRRRNRARGEAVPALSLRACPMPGARSGRRNLSGGWAEPPKLLCGRRWPSARMEEVWKEAQEGGGVVSERERAE